MGDDVEELLPFTQQRYQFLVEVERGRIWYDPKWRVYRRTGTPRGSTAGSKALDFIGRFGLVYETQKINAVGWFQCGLTLDGQILIARWRERKRRELRDTQYKRP